MTPKDKKRIEDFLKKCKTNIGPNITDTIIYDKLKSYGLQNNDFKDGKLKNIEPLFQKWVKKYEDNFFHKHTYSILRYPNNDWLGFQSKKINSSNREWNKIYISITNEYLKDCVKEIIQFLDKNEDFEYTMKIANEMRSDNIVIRIKNENDAIRIIDFIRNNPMIMKGLNPNNPFIPNINGINIIKDNEGSYNDFLSSLISNYLNKTSFEKINYSTFLEYLKTAPINYTYINDMETYFEYYNLSFHNLKPNDETKKEPQISTISQQEEVKKIQNYKQEVLLKAAIQTYIEYQNVNMGYEQLFFAIQQAIENGNYDYFTNNSGSRDLLSSFIPPQEIISIMMIALNISTPYQDTKEIIDIYIKNIQETYLENEKSQKNK